MALTQGEKIHFQRDGRKSRVFVSVGVSGLIRPDTLDPNRMASSGI